MLTVTTRRLAYRCLLIITSLYLAACQYHIGGCRTQNVPAEKVLRITSRYELEPFSQVRVDGRVNVTLHTGYKKPAMVIQGDARDVNYLKTTVTQGVLIVQLGKGYPHFGPVHLDIRARNLNGFTYHGIGEIKGPRLRAQALDLNIDNKGSTVLSGQLGLRRLVVKGQGLVDIRQLNTSYLCLDLAGETNTRLIGFANVGTIAMKDKAKLSLYWLKSNQLRVSAKDKTYLQLAGVTDTLNATLCNSACFDGRYLRAENTFVKTFDSASAKVTTLNKQHLLANDDSTIEYYHLPLLRSDYMATNGAILDARKLIDRTHRSKH